MTPRAAILLLMGRADARSIAEIERDVADEFAGHLAALEAEGLRSGLAPAEAALRARTRFGDVENLRAQCRRIALEERLMLKRIHLVITCVLAVVVLAMGAALFVGVQVQARRMEEAHRARAEAALQHARAAEVESFLTSTLTAIDPVAGQRVTVEDILDHASARIETDFHDRPELAAQLRETIDEARAKIAECNREDPGSP